MVPARPLTRAALAAIVAAAVAIRLLHLHAIADTAFPRFPLALTESDMHAFWSWAQAIAAGDWLGRDTYHPDFAWMREMASRETWHRWWGGVEIFHQSPLYPYFVAAVVRATGAGDPTPVLLVQLLLGALQPLVVFALVRRIADERAGLVAAAITALYAPFVFHQGVLLRDWLPPILEPLALVLLLRAADRDHARDWLLAGVALGVALLDRETALLLVPAAGLWLGLERWGRWRELAIAVLLVALGFAAALAPVAARNAAVGAPLFSLSNRGGVTFAQHNAAASSGLWSEYDPAVQQQILARADAGGSIVRETLATYPSAAAFALKIATKLRGAADPIEIPSNVGFAYGREISWVLRALPGYGWVFPLGVVGVGLSLGRWRRNALVFLYLGIAVATLVISLPLGRYRLPLATVWIVYAGVATIAALDAARARRLGRLAVIGAAVAGVAVLQHAVLSVPGLRSAGWMAMYGAGAEHRAAAEIYAGEGRLDRAADELARLRARANDDPWTQEIARGIAPIEERLRAEWAARRDAAPAPR